MNYALKLNNVTKTYKGSDFSLNKVSFALPSGSVMGFVGENGAGKTTTIGCILRTLFKDSGTIEILGTEMTDDNVEIRENIGVVYDGDNFPGYLSAEQLSNIMSGIFKHWDDTLFQNYIKSFRLSKKQKIKTYSKGMTMKLALAVALSHHPKLLILDEATSGLDPVMRDEILDVLLEFVGDEEHSILLSSHITSDLEKIADYITFIHNGKIILTETKDNLIYNYGILRCKEKQVELIEPEDIIVYRKRDYQTDILVSNMNIAERKYPGVVIDHVTIDEIMLMLVKGNEI
ncbi:ABC transporter ATP-binding protein [Mordavella massiliensis]|uniref:ABC transporter ATP-binding protein n=1 Tax=Mordavella massiliensis TaxID=1871024 RepID=A0A938X3H9_9CLOT|nr:ABC transporter ATP-binding protein [Mordavella massiliensis]MBM6827479.1 ABC transporter ATP-binding protein [Mordavella massiliensis]